MNGLFPKLPKLVWLNISDNRLNKFDFELVPRGLQWLDLHANRLTELTNHLDLSPFRITTLDASANRLTELAGSAIPDSVELLFLSDNLISKVSPFFLYKCVIYILVKFIFLSSPPHAAFLRINNVCGAMRRHANSYVAVCCFQKLFIPF